MKNIFSLSIVRKGPKRDLGALLRRSSLICLMISALLISGFALPQTVSAKDNAANQHWVGTWSTSPMSPSIFAPPPSFNDQTLRQIVHITIGGDLLRVRFSNSFGNESLVINAASIGIQGTGATIFPGSLRQLTFGGDPSIMVPPGARVLSDPVDLTVAAEEDLAISMYVAEYTGDLTLHASAHQTSYISPVGDYTAEEVMPVAETTTSWFWLTGVEVLAHRNTFAVVTIGDSITDGSQSTLDANARYPDWLARRLLARYKGEPKVAVLNEGIGGNRILSDGLGVNALARLDRDVLTQSGVTQVILLEGINDIGFPNIPFPLPPDIPSDPVSAEEIIAGMKQIIKRAHARGLKIFGGTILPFYEALYFTPEGEEKRQAVNAWIRTSGAFDGVIDFDEALRDPSNPEPFPTMLPIYDSGDNLHPSDAGYERMGEEAEKVLLEPGRGRIQRP